MVDTLVEMSAQTAAKWHLGTVAQHYHVIPVQHWLYLPNLIKVYQGRPADPCKFLQTEPLFDRRK